MNAQAPETGSAPNRGGQNALAGFLFQILGTQNRAIALEVGSPEDPELEARILHEALGQDAAVELGATGRPKVCELVQFKYSRQAAPPPIGKEEFHKIVARLKESETHTKGLGCAEIRYRLVSNRALGRTAVQLIADAQGRLAVKKGRRQSTDKILSDLVTEHLSIETALENLRYMAKCYGSLSNEIDRAINWWIGELVRKTVAHGATEVSTGDFVSALLGTPNASPLTAKSVGPRAREAVRLAAQNDLWVPPNTIHRYVVNELAQAVLDHALVLLDGEGGAGKTVALMQGALDRLELPEDSGALTAVAVAEHVREDWAQTVVRRWTGVGITGPTSWRNDDVETSVRRVYIANTDLPHPVLWLGLDGVDEVNPADQEKIRALVHHFAREELNLRRTGVRPLASLVVTCRGRGPFERLLPKSRTEPRPLYEAYFRVGVTEFGRDELLRAGASVPLAIRNRLRIGLTERESELASLGEQGSAMLVDVRSALPTPLGGASRSPARAPDPTVLRSLEHPPMWRGFVSLAEADQHRALDGDDRALTYLGWWFVRWFLNKAMLRSAEWRIMEADLPTLLVAAAHATFPRNESSHRRIDDWVYPLRDTGLITDAGALAFFREAASAGVVEETGPKWAWRHAFLPRALVAGEPESLGAPERA